MGVGGSALATVIVTGTGFSSSRKTIKQEIVLVGLLNRLIRETGERLTLLRSRRCDASLSYRARPSGSRAEKKEEEKKKKKKGG